MWISVFLFLFLFFAFNPGTQFLCSCLEGVTYWVNIVDNWAVLCVMQWFKNIVTKSVCLTVNSDEAWVTCGFKAILICMLENRHFHVWACQKSSHWDHSKITRVPLWGCREQFSDNLPGQNNQINRFQDFQASSALKIVGSGAPSQPFVCVISLA